MAHKQRWGELFKVLDYNNNGTIEKQDISSLSKEISSKANLPESDPQIKGVTAAYGALRINNLIDSFDTDKDGKITKDEYFEGVEKHFIGKTPETIPRWLRRCMEDFFPSYDKNEDGEISLEELKVGIKAADPDQSDDNIAKAYEWVRKQGKSGKFDLETFYNMGYLWATSPNVLPEVSILTPYFRKRIVIWGKLFIALY